MGFVSFLPGRCLFGNGDINNSLSKKNARHDIHPGTNTSKTGGNPVPLLSAM